MKRLTSNIALYYLPDAYDVSGKKLMGRQAAGEAFLKSYVRHSGSNSLYCYTKDKTLYAEFVEKTTDYSDKLYDLKYIEFNDLTRLSNVGCLYYPSPAISELAWQRQTIGSDAYSLCGVTHTTCSKTVIEQISTFTAAPIEPWDAIICTSEAVKKTIELILDEWSMYLKSKFKLKRKQKPKIQLPIIPLGFDEDILLSDAAAGTARQSWRAKLGIHDNDFVFLFFGRLTYHAKAHPLPMYKALELAATYTKKKIHLILAGWFSNEAVKKAFEKGSQTYCPSIELHIVDGRESAVKKTIWYAADIFTSLSDNIQETYGLTPLEAMAAGLPVVVTDWNGYRQTVIDEETGYLITTMTPEKGTLSDLGLMYQTQSITYDYYIGIASQFTYVSEHEVASAYISLISDDSKRKQMGHNAKLHALTHFRWSTIIKKYQELWLELDKIRPSRKISESNQQLRCHPLLSDPMKLFGHYSTAEFDDKLSLSISKEVAHKDLELLFESALANYALNFLLTRDEIEQVFTAIDHCEGKTLDQIITATNDLSTKKVRLAAMWLLKYGIIRIDR